MDTSTFGDEDARDIEEGQPNYTVALQKALYFYDAERSGDLPDDFRASFRGDSELSDYAVPLDPQHTNLSQAFIDAHADVLDPDGDGAVNLGGGFHDAGDHVKFGLPQAYAASTLGFGLHEFRESFERTGQLGYILGTLRWFADYFLRSSFRGDDGEVVAFAYQVGEGSIDHSYWGPPELQLESEYPRPAFFATAETPASDQAAGAAAALALTSLATESTDAEYAERCLQEAEALYRFAVAHRGLGYSGGFYNSGGDADELAWAAVWLHVATGERGYLDDIVRVEAGAYRGYLGAIMATEADGWQNIWVHCWDAVWGGTLVALSSLVDNPKIEALARWNIEYWSGIAHEDGSSGFLKASPAGYRVLTTWGSARYNTAAQLEALVFHKHKGRKDFAEFAKGQMDYLLGDNPLGRSYVVGFGESPARHPHHRAAHGSTTGSMLDPVEHRHVLYGALVGGPDLDDWHVDATDDFVYNEVGVDYNAAFVGALAGLIAYYGEGMKPLASFPPKEAAHDEVYSVASLGPEDDARTQFTIAVTNDSTSPPRFMDDLKARYFFDASELYEAGQTIDDVAAEVFYDEEKSLGKAATKVTGPLPWDEARHIYYVEADWSGHAIHGDREIQIGLIAAMDSSYETNWDPTNDWSREGLGSAPETTPRIPVYRGGELVYGEEP